MPGPCSNKWAGASIYVPVWLAIDMLDTLIPCFLFIL